MSLAATSPSFWGQFRDLLGRGGIAVSRLRQSFGNFSNGVEEDGNNKNQGNDNDLEKKDENTSVLPCAGGSDEKQEGAPADPSTPSIDSKIIPGSLMQAVCTDNPDKEVLQRLIAQCQTLAELNDTKAFDINFGLTPFMEAAHWWTGDGRSILWDFWNKYQALCGSDTEQLAQVLTQQDYREWNLFLFALHSDDVENVTLVLHFYQHAFGKDGTEFLLQHVESADDRMFSMEQKEFARGLLTSSPNQLDGDDRNKAKGATGKRNPCAIAGRKKQRAKRTKI